MASSDYGVIVLKNNEVYERETTELQRLIEDGENKIGFYKNGLFVNDHEAIWVLLRFDKKKTLKLTIDGIDFKIKNIVDDRFLAKFKINGNFYKVYFGYGVDKHMETIYSLRRGYYNISKREINFLKRLGFKID